MLVPDLRAEMKEISLGDRRLDGRFLSIVGALQEQPAAGFPRALGSEAALEGFYRFTNNERVDPDALLKPHQRRAWSRAAHAPLRLVLHDSTEFSFEGEAERTGLQRVGKRQVLHGHLSLLTEEGEAPSVHGVVCMRTYVIDKGIWNEVLAERTLGPLLVGSERWQDAVLAVHHDAPPGAPLVHVMDREADDYPLWMKIVDQGDHFVIRSTHDRRIVDAESVSLHETLESVPFVAQREVWLSRRTGGRPPKSRKTHPDRDHRPAKLGIRFGHVEVQRPQAIRGEAHPRMRLGLIEVIELDPPDNVEPVCWRLLTTLPVETAEDACRIVDIYRRRWLIEEFFRAWKTGCAAEKRQAEDLWTLVRTLTILVPIAWRLLVLRAVSRQMPDAPAEAVVDAVELEALRSTHAGKKLPPRPTAGEVTAAIARLGGHLKSNGAPGWIVLYRGLQELRTLATGWRAALRWRTSQGDEKQDQDDEVEM